MNSLDYENLKSNLRSYLESHNINTSKMFNCINPNHRDINASMKYYDDNKVYCFGCGECYNLFDAICAIENVGPKEAFNRALQYFCHGQKITPRQIKKIVKEDKIEKENKDYNKAYNYWHKKLKANKQAKEYLRTRKISDKTIDKFNLGYNEFDFIAGGLKAIVIPITDNSYTARNISNEGNVRYYKSKGSHTDIFNKKALVNNIPFCFICEGEFDCLSFETVNANSIALGSTCNIEKFKNIEKNKNKVYIIALDNDEAGEKANLELKEYFRDNHIKFLDFDNLGFKDPNQALVQDENNFRNSINQIIERVNRKIKQDEMM